MCVLSEWPHIPLAQNKVYSNYHYPANRSPCGETLAQGFLARFRASLEERAGMSKSSLIHSLWHQNHPGCLAWDYARTYCQNNCRLGLEKRLTVDYNCCNNWSRGPGGSFSWLRDIIIQQSSLIRSKLQGSIIQQRTGCMCDCKDTSEINQVETVFIHMASFLSSILPRVNPPLFLIFTDLHLITPLHYPYFPHLLSSLRSRSIWQFLQNTNQPSFPNA